MRNRPKTNRRRKSFFKQKRKRARKLLPRRKPLKISFFKTTKDTNRFFSLYDTVFQKEAQK